MKWTLDVDMKGLAIFDFFPPWTRNSNKFFFRKFWTPNYTPWTPNLVYKWRRKFKILIFKDIAKCSFFIILCWFLIGPNSQNVWTHALSFVVQLLWNIPLLNVCLSLPDLLSFGSSLLTCWIATFFRSISKTCPDLLQAYL